MCVCECVSECVFLSVIKCSSNPLQLKLLGGRGQTKKGGKKNEYYKL